MGYLHASILCLLVAVASAANVGFFFGGPFLGSCGPDGYYHGGAGSFVQCTGGRPYTQQCAPGTENSPLEYYKAGYYRSITIFCDVNLNDDAMKEMMAAAVEDAMQAQDEMAHTEEVEGMGIIDLGGTMGGDGGEAGEAVENPDAAAAPVDAGESSEETSENSAEGEASEAAEAGNADEAVTEAGDAAEANNSDDVAAEADGEAAADDDTPAEETTTEESPADDTPANDTPAEESPADDTPAEESSDAKAEASMKSYNYKSGYYHPYHGYPYYAHPPYPYGRFPYDNPYYRKYY